MTEKEYKEHIQYTHNAYCRIFIRHASIDAARMLYAKWKREISLEYLSEERFMPFSTADEYFAQPPMDEDYPFTASGQIVLINDPTLAAALSMLPQQKQEEIFPVLLPALYAKGNRQAVRADTQHRRAAYPACLAPDTAGNGGDCP